MRFDVTVLGCGAATPTLRFQPTSQVLNVAENWFLIDAGEGVQRSLREQRVPFHKIKRIFISHMHGDHVLGLPGLIGSLNLLGRKEELLLHGPAGLEAFVMSSLKTTETHLKFHLEFIRNDPNELFPCWETGPLTIYSFPVKHRVEAYGYRVSLVPNQLNLKKDAVVEHQLSRSEMVRLKRGDSIERKDGTLLKSSELCFPMQSSKHYVFSGDTAPCQELIDSASGADLLYHEATFLQVLSKRAKVTGHSTAAEAGQSALSAGVKRLLIGHFSSRYRTLTPLLLEAQSVFPLAELAVEGCCYKL